MTNNKVKQLQSGDELEFDNAEYTLFTCCGCGLTHALIRSGDHIFVYVDSVESAIQIKKRKKKK